MNRQLEICAGDIRSVMAAAEGGANRVELCSALSEGGLTPSAGLIRQALEVESLRVHVLIRPRPGDFCYDSNEMRTMVSDIETAAKLGAHAVVIGALTPDGDIDTDACRRMIDAAGGCSITFHRAFDLCRDPIDALGKIIEMGIDRILTSGLAPSAIEGAEMIKELVDRAGNSLKILPGGGVNPDNAAEIIRLTGASELHASARKAYESPMEFRRVGIYMGASGADEYSMKFTSPEIVGRIVKAINEV